ncbi:MAG: hypothetical protein NXI13_03275 [Proteobacteria bacterium]|nr:hypothetical protein [Pseudomonadota bacterium]
MYFIRTILIAALAAISTLGHAISAPLSVEGGKQVVANAPATTASVALSDSSVGLAQADGALSTLTVSGFSFPPALLLFVLALSAIVWLGRRRKKDDFVEE